MTHFPGNITDVSDIDFYNWLIIYDQRHKAKSVGLYEAIDTFKSELYDVCISKIASDEQAPEFNSLLGKIRKLADTSSPELNILKAKNYPIMRLAEELAGEPVRFGKIHCPLHSDSTPSLHLYSASNRFKCFACQKHGDPIDLLMIFCPGLSFPEAVKRLS